MDHNRQDTASPKNGLLKPLVVLWLAITLLLSYEYLALNKITKYGSILHKMQSIGLIGKKISLTTEPGSTISFFMGWFGFGIICATNIYVYQKRQKTLLPVGQLSRSIEYHIFYGLLGPTAIVFHANFNVHGLVAISFWSMMVSVASGVVGRYFYLQLLKERVDLKDVLTRYDQAFERARSVAKHPWNNHVFEDAKWSFFVHVGGSLALHTGKAAVHEVLWQSIVGDVKRIIYRKHLPSELPKSLEKPLIEYSVAKRRLHSSTHYRRLMGYWHTFHRPFAIFMYVVSFIHIIAALIFRVH